MTSSKETEVYDLEVHVAVFVFNCFMWIAYCSGVL